MKRKKQDKKNKAPTVEDRVGSFGLEPPKRYRESQYQTQDTRVHISEGQKRKKTLSTQEARELQDKKRSRKRGVRKGLLIAGLVIMSFLILLVLSFTVFFQIENISVADNNVYSKEEILSICTIDKGENLFLADTKKAKIKIEENLPYVYEAQIKRKLPSSIEVNIIEANPAYVIDSEQEEYVLLDDRFKVLEIISQLPSNIILIEKAETKSVELGKTVDFTEEKTLECLQSLADAIKVCNFEEATMISSKGLNQNYIMYDNRIRFDLGDCEELENKIFKGLAACDELNQNNPEVKGVLKINNDKSIYFTDETA